MPLQHPRVHVPKLRPRVIPEVPRPHDVRRTVLVLPPSRVDQYWRLPVQVLEQVAPLGRAVVHDSSVCPHAGNGGEQRLQEPQLPRPARRQDLVHLHLADGAPFHEWVWRPRATP